MPPHQRAYALLISPKLAIALLVVVLAACLVGVTAFRDARAYELIFSTLWFNGLLVLLAVSSAAAFFSRIWRRKLTLVSGGMILFHVSFAAMLGGIVYNSLFHFRGVLRLTEGETLANGQIESYDEAERGRFFQLSRLGGETTLVKTHVNYEVDGQNKKVAYEVEIGGAESRKRGIIYATQNLVFDGVRYFRSKEGYSVLVVMYEKDGREVYGLHIPLQSYRQDDGTFRYATGTATEEAAFRFPLPPAEPRADLALSFRPSTVAPREGEVTFQVLPTAQPGGAHGDDEGGTAKAGLHDGAGSGKGGTAVGPHDGAGSGMGGSAPAGRSGGGDSAHAGLHEGAEAGKSGTVAVGAKFDAGEFTLVPREIRFWVAMDVRYDPGLVVILTSLCLGLGGMVLTFVGRVRQGAGKRRAA